MSESATHSSWICTWGNQCIGFPPYTPLQSPQVWPHSCDSWGPDPVLWSSLSLGCAEPRLPAMLPNQSRVSLLSMAAKKRSDFLKKDSDERPFRDPRMKEILKARQPLGEKPKMQKHLERCLWLTRHFQVPSCLSPEPQGSRTPDSQIKTS